MLPVPLVTSSSETGSPQLVLRNSAVQEPWTLLCFSRVFGRIAVYTVFTNAVGSGIIGYKKLFREETNMLVLKVAQHSPDTRLHSNLVNVWLQNFLKFVLCMPAGSPLQIEMHQKHWKMTYKKTLNTSS